MVTESGIDYPTAAVVTYAGGSGEEEMHVFFSMAWWNLDSWAWGHYIAEWGTKGIFAVGIASQFRFNLLRLQIRVIYVGGHVLRAK